MRQDVIRSKETAKRIATSIRLLPEMLAEAQEAARKSNMSMNALFEEAVRMYLATNKEKI